uniref:MFS transporter n=1 Tax=Janibacter limosus TaxID=53458 RepID=A0AC61U3G6_9MICO|nr:MFS transporter [Janibacter limosus]
MSLPSSSAPTARTSSHVGIALSALVLGGVGIGVTEFVTMGLLPEIARGVGTSIPQAGHTISAYALGVVVGAPAIAIFGNRLPRRELLVALMVLFAIGNALSAMAGGYELLMLARFVSGIPHGAFFGIASIVAYDIVAVGRGGWAVSRIMLGIPIANVAGVPLATRLGQQAGWRSAYWLVAAPGILTAVLVSTVVPHRAADTEADVRSELSAFKDAQVWLTLLIGAIGFGGVFAMYSYISPILRNQTGLPANAVPIYLFVYGVGGLLGTVIAGRLVDRSVLRTLVGSTIATGLSLAAFARAADWAIPAAIVLLLVCISVSAFVLALQLRLMEVAGKARTLGAAGNHAALNVANALGPGSAGSSRPPAGAGGPPRWSARACPPAGLVVLFLSLRVHRGRTTLD